jgi:WxcM-like, C-terminal.
MKNIDHYQFHKFADEYGNLVALEELDDIPFAVKRVYYIFGVGAGVRRGFHSHLTLNQMLICVNGSVKIMVKTPYEETTVELNDPSHGLYIGPMIWREMHDFSPGAVLLVLASEHYDESDYIRNYKEYESMAINYFNKSCEKK